MKLRFSLGSVVVFTTGVCIVGGAFANSVQWGVISTLFVFPALAGWIQNHIEDFS